MRHRPGLLVALAALAAGLAPPPDAAAQEAPVPQADHPTLAVEPAVAKPGDAVVVTISGFRARNVTVTVCGNAAARGSVDCNQGAGEGMGLRTATTQRGIVIQAPPTPCPCVLRVASRTQDEVAIAPIELVGHPVGEVVRSETTPLVDVSIDARRAPAGLIGRLRTALGGPTEYEVDVTVRNRSGLPLDDVTVRASARRGSTTVASLGLPDLGTLAPGQVWTHVTTATLGAPMVGSVVWEARVSGAGPDVADTAAGRAVPYLLFVFAALLVGDIVAIVTRRWAMRRREPFPHRRRRVTARRAETLRSTVALAPHEVQVPAMPPL